MSVSKPWPLCFEPAYKVVFCLNKKCHRSSGQRPSRLLKNKYDPRNHTELHETHPLMGATSCDFVDRFTASVATTNSPVPIAIQNYRAVVITTRKRAAPLIMRS